MEARYTLKKTVFLSLWLAVVFLCTASALSHAGWEQVNEGGFGVTRNEIASTMTFFNNALYVGTGGTLVFGSLAELWRSPDGTSWEQVIADGFGDSHNTACRSMVVYDGYLYVGTGNESTGAELWRSPDGTGWEQVNTDGFGDFRNVTCSSLVVYDGFLYAGTSNRSTGAELWRSPDGTSWEQVNTDGFGESNNTGCYGLLVHGDFLYGGTYNSATGCQVWRSADGTTWDPVITDGFGDPNNGGCSPLIAYGDYCYVGTGNKVTGAELWRSPDGTSWGQVNTDGFGNNRNEVVGAMIVWDTVLHVGTDNRLTGCQMWRSQDGRAWEQVNEDGFGDSENEACYAAVLYNGLPYVGTSNRTTGCQLWRPTFTLSGSVTGAVSTQVPVYLRGSTSQAVKTDGSGQYQFTDVSAGAYVITPELEGYRFEPPEYTIKSLDHDLPKMDFVSRRALPCAAATIYGEGSEEIALLRRVRDTVLQQTPEGKELIRLYYQWSPAVAAAVEGDEAIRSDLKEIIDALLPAVGEGRQ